MGQPGSTSSGPGFFNVFIIVAIFGVMYFFMIRPQAKKAKDQKNFIESLQKGDKIVTVGACMEEFYASMKTERWK